VYKIRRKLGLTSGGQTRFVNLKGGAFERVLKFMNAGEKTICLSAKWQDIETPTLENFVLVSVPDFHGSEMSSFKNGGVCGQVQARPDHALSEMPVTLTSGGQTRFVNLKGGAFERVLKFMNAGEKTICLSAKWEDIETPTLENFVLVSVPDFHGAEGGK
jgi:hypothetical protein